MLYLLARRLFGSDAYAVCATVSALCAGALFVGSISASGALGTGFVLFAYYNAVGFYTRDRKFADKKATYINILSTGLAIGIAAAFRPTDFIACAGVAVIWALGLKKTAIEYKKEYKEAKGLGKEDVFLAFRSARNTYLWLMPTAFIVLPILAVGATYAAEAGQLASHYGVGWISAVFCDLARFFIPHYDIFPLAYLLGMGGDKAEFLNYIPCALFAVSFIICTAITATGKFALLKSNIKNKYALITIAFAAALLPVLTGLNDKIAGLAALTCIYSLYLPLALAALEKAWGKKATTGAAIAACALSALTFAGCYIGLCAFGINDVAAKILYLWQVA